MSESLDRGIEVPELTADEIQARVLHRDGLMLVIDKPAGLVVHPGAGQPDRTLLNALLAHAPALAGVPRAGIVHRLDKDTSGLLVVANSRGSTLCADDSRARPNGRSAAFRHAHSICAALRARLPCPSGHGEPADGGRGQHDRERGL